MIWKHLLVFVATIIFEVFMTMWTLRLTQRRAVSAANWSALSTGFGALVTISYTKDPQYVVSLLVGAWLGTFIAVKWESRAVRD